MCASPATVRSPSPPCTTRVEDLTAATHAHLLAARPETFVHLDVAHRGLGTFACGPDTHDRFKLHGATYRFRWTLTA